MMTPKGRITLVAGMAVTLLTISFGGGSVAVARSRGEFKQADSAAELKKARGLVYDWTTPADWVVSGEWTLNCKEACASAGLNEIQFDLTVAMVRSGFVMTSPGAASHSHSFTDFSATGATISGDDLTITGTITGSGPIGSANITIRLNGVNGAGTFSFELTTAGAPNSHLMGEIGGVIVESKD